MKKVRVGIYGKNGHQVHWKMNNELRSKVRLAAFCECDVPAEWSNASHYATLEQMLNDDSLELISLCAPNRREQAMQAVLCMESGKDVYAEKPCAMTEDDLNMLIDTAHRTGRRFHEMAGTAFEQPYFTMRKIVQAGHIGDVVQVSAQKSYPPDFNKRPQNEDIDGGLICQNGIHAIRFIEHVALQRIIGISAIQTNLGNPIPEGGLNTAASYMMRLENGGVASAVANYLNPKEGFGLHGNETLRIFGSLGFIEAVDGGVKTRLVIGAKDFGEIEVGEEPASYFHMYINNILGISDMPLSLEEELHPTRVVIKARNSALKEGEFVNV